MTDRDAACRALAEAMGWHYDSESGWFDGPHPTIRGADAALFRVPAPDAPLHEQLSFVGRLIEAVGVSDYAIESPTPYTGDTKFRVSMWTEESDGGCVGNAPDLVLAALNAAIRAKGGRS